MRAAGRQLEQLDFPGDDSFAAQAADRSAELKQEVAKRLAAHRTRRGKVSETGPIPIAELQQTKSPAGRIARAVAERYAQTQSYRDYLAAEAARAVEEANAAAEIAARNAEAITFAQQQLLAELDAWNETYLQEPSPTAYRSSAGSVDGSSTPRRDLAPVPHPVQGATVRLYQDRGFLFAAAAPASREERGAPDAPFDEEENFLLDDEIAFRQTPVFAEPAGPPIPIPANLIEFPRQLIAPRRARPRIAEGPLREEADSAPASAQLRIFEVEPEQIATVPGLGVQVVVPEWSSIRLDAAPVAAPLVDQDAQEELQALLPLETASLNLRAMAAAVDGCILGATFLATVAAFASRAAVLPTLPIAAIGSAATILILFVLYHLLFFTFSEATPGMRYARIGLCTFSDENPTREQMRRRTWAILLSACPLGIGFLWALLDDDRLGWHDRISRMYQRGY